MPFRFPFRFGQKAGISRKLLVDLFRKFHLHLILCENSTKFFLSFGSFKVFRIGAKLRLFSNTFVLASVRIFLLRLKTVSEQKNPFERPCSVKEPGISVHFFLKTLALELMRFVCTH